MPIDYSKWDNLDSGSEDDKKPVVTTGKPEYVGPPEKFDSKHTAPLKDVPEMLADPAEGVSPSVAKYFVTTMTEPQRVLTFGHLWNASDKDSRRKYLQKLVEIINDEKVTKSIKGGGEILEDMEVEFYDKCSYPKKWVAYFKTQEEEKRIEMIGALYRALDSAEQKFIVGGLSK